MFTTSNPPKNKARFCEKYPRTLKLSLKSYNRTVKNYKTVTSFAPSAIIGPDLINFMCSFLHRNGRQTSTVFFVALRRAHNGRLHRGGRKDKWKFIQFKGQNSEVRGCGRTLSAPDLFIKQKHL